MGPRRIVGASPASGRELYDMNCDPMYTQDIRSCLAAHIATKLAQRVGSMPLRLHSASAVLQKGTGCKMMKSTVSRDPCDSETEDEPVSLKLARSCPGLLLWMDESGQPMPGFSRDEALPLNGNTANAGT